MNDIYIYGKHLNPVGVQVIIENIKKAMQKHNVNVCVINTLDGVGKDSFILPYGISAAVDMIKKRYSCEIALMIDAMSLGVLSEFLYSFSKKSMPISFKCKLLFQFFYFLFLEIFTLFKYKTIVLVSDYDKSYFNVFLNRSIIKKITIIHNGVDFPVSDKLNNYKLPQETLVLGIISMWDDAAFYNTKWFIESYLFRLREQFPFIKLVIAGKGADKKMIDYWKNKESIQYMGEIKDVAEFYQSIDVSLITLSKKCGILNKVLEAFAYKKIVLGLPQNFYAFKELSNAFFVYKDYDFLIKSVQEIIENPHEVEEKVNKAFNYIKQYHSWERNYAAFEKIILQDI